MKTQNKSIQAKFSEKTKQTYFEFVDTDIEKLDLFDVLIEVKAISVNPVDYKIASSINKLNLEPKVLGWDVSGVVREVGTSVRDFKTGDEVYYAGELMRPGGNSYQHVVDSRLMSIIPKNLNHKEAAALPLTTLTAWEGLFDGLKINPEYTKGKSILVIGGAGGVGSMVTQLAKQLTNLTVINTASREESILWCKKMGADYVIDRKPNIKSELQKIGFDEVDYVFCTNDTEGYFDQFADMVKPFGRIVSVVELSKPVELGNFFKKCISFSWEFMFARSLFKTPDFAHQGEILKHVKTMIEEGKIHSTMALDLGEMTPENIEKAHQILHSGASIGKIVMGGIK